MSRYIKELTKENIIMKFRIYKFLNQDKPRTLKEIMEHVSDTRLTVDEVVGILLYMQEDNQILRVATKSKENPYLYWSFDNIRSSDKDVLDIYMGDSKSVANINFNLSKRIDEITSDPDLVKYRIRIYKDVKLYQLSYVTKFGSVIHEVGFFGENYVNINNLSSQQRIELKEKLKAANVKNTIINNLLSN